MTVARSLSGRTDLVAPAMLVLGTVLAAAVLWPKPTMIAIGIPVAVAGAVYVVRRPLVTLIVMVVIEVTNLNGVVAQRTPLPVFYLSFGLGLVALVIALCDQPMRSRLNRGTVVCIGLIGCYLLTQLLAALGSRDVDVSMSTMKSNILGCAFLVVVLMLAQMTAKPWAIAGAIVVPLAVISVLCLISQVGFDGAATFGGFAVATDASGELITTLRFGGPGLDSNFWGRVLVLGLPLAAALAFRAGRAGRRWPTAGWMAALVAVLVGVYLTQSRGGLIAAAVLLLVWVVASGPAARRLGFRSLPVVALVLLLPGIGNRLIAVLGDVGSAATYRVDPSVLGRLAAQEAAWAMFRDRPMFGFGPGVFAQSMMPYAGRVPTAVLEPPDAPHNLYAQLAAESGVVGLLGWLAFVGGFAVFIGIRIARLATYGARAESDRALAAAALAAIVGWSVASTFLHLSSFSTFAIVLALAGALAAEPDSRPRVDNGQSRTLMRQLAAGVMVGGVVAGIALSVCTSQTRVASQAITLLPTKREEPWSYAYALDIRSRQVVLPTYAAMMTSDGSKATAVADPVRGVITINVPDTGNHPARADLDVALAAASTELSGHGADNWYTIVPVGDPEVATHPLRSVTATVVSVLAGVLAAAATVLVMRHGPLVGALRRRRAGLRRISRGTS